MKVTDILDSTEKQNTIRRDGFFIARIDGDDDIKSLFYYFYKNNFYEMFYKKGELKTVSKYKKPKNCDLFIIRGNMQERVKKEIKSKNKHLFDILFNL